MRGCSRRSRRRACEGFSGLRAEANAVDAGGIGEACRQTGAGKDPQGRPGGRLEQPLSAAEAAAIHADDPDFPRLAGEGRVVAYFGYGSLVNRDTLRTKFLAIRRARASGWRRFWMPRPTVGIALLSVREEACATVDGVVVYDLADNLGAVDEREAGYDRRTVAPGALEIENAPPATLPVFVYEATRPGETAADTGSAILQSYLDAVMQGFLAIHGEAGLHRFVAETDGFETTVIRDRAAPLYPRSVTLRAGEAERFDALLAARGVVFRNG